MVESQHAFALHARQRRPRVPALARRMPRPAVRQSRDLQRVSVVVPAHNEEASIGQVLASLRWQTCPPAAIYVIADNCTDRTAQMAAQEDGVQVF
ncbi:MAG TPA: glycosyltransferase, partial [Streptosporangiaceae bacterium]